MLDRKLVRTRFVEGIPPSMSVFRKSDDYLENKSKILSLGGLGYGVLFGYKESLALAIKDDILVVKSGAAIDKDGNLIYVPSTEIVQHKINIVDFIDKQRIYVYIKYEEQQEGEVLPINGDGGAKIKSEFVRSYCLFVTDHIQDNNSNEWIELGRVSIHYNKISEHGSERICEPYNPFLPRDNEIDLRSVPKISTNLVALDEDKNSEVYRTLGGFSDYLNEISFRFKLFSASVASSFIYQMREDIYTNAITPYAFYQKLKESILIVEKIKEEKPEIEDCDFWLNINQLKNLFNIGFGEKHQEKIDFYKFDIYETTYFGRILNHFKLAAACSRDLNFEVKKNVVEEPEHKGYVQVGRSPKEEDKNDIYEEFKNDKTVSRKHLIITVDDGDIWIEDQKSANGTRINGEKIPPKIKRFVRSSDTVILGKKNSRLNLRDTKIQELLNL